MCTCAVHHHHENHRPRSHGHISFADETSGQVLKFCLVWPVVFHSLLALTVIDPAHMMLHSSTAARLYLYFGAREFESGNIFSPLLSSIFLQCTELFYLVARFKNSWPTFCLNIWLWNSFLLGKHTKMLKHFVHSTLLWTYFMHDTFLAEKEIIDLTGSALIPIFLVGLLIFLHCEMHYYYYLMHRAHTAPPQGSIWFYIYCSRYHRPRGSPLCTGVSGSGGWLYQPTAGSSCANGPGSVAGIWQRGQVLLWWW